MTTNEKIRAVRMFIIGLALVFSICMFLFVLPAKANMFPSDAVTQHFEFTANTPTGGSVLLATSTRTILNISWDNKPGAGTRGWLYCGGATEGNEIFENHASDGNTIPMSFYCANEIRAIVTGHNAEGEHYILTWVDYDLSTIVATSTISAIIQPTPMQDIFYGIVIFFLIAGSVLYLFRRMI